MFQNTSAFGSLAVDDLTKAKDFYGRLLGLPVERTPEGLELRLAGGTPVFLYRPGEFVPPRHTVLNFVVDDIDEALAGLEERGIRMEHYDAPEIRTDERGIHRGTTGPKAVAWFKDPAGNVLSVVQER
jgi:predicted enzyme related to lactoylglutathione lyase